MKIYLASDRGNRAMMNLVEDWLTLLFSDRITGLTFVSDWYRKPPEPDKELRDGLTFDHISECDLIISCFPYGIGTSAEVAQSVQQGKLNIYYRSPWDTDDEHVQELMASQFAPNVMIATTPRELMNYIERSADLIAKRGR